MIPKKIKIGGQWYKITLKNFTKELADDKSIGKYNSYANEILLDDKQLPSTMQQTLLHEIVEVIDHQWELNLDHHQISALEATLFAVLKDNKLNFNGN